MVPIEQIEKIIYVMRNQKVMLDRDLAVLYGVPTKRLNEQVSRNIERFPKDFAFQLSDVEWINLKSQIATSNCSRSQIATLKRGQNLKYMPYAFTEQGVAMLSSVLRSPQAVAVNIEIMRAFVSMRKVFASHEKISEKLDEMKSFLLKHSNQNDKEFRRVWNAIEKLSQPINQRKIGFDLNQ
jgi:phage regulator Rha-like protein